MPRRAWYLILAQLAIIIFLTFSLISQYIFDRYFQDYVNGTVPILIPLLSVTFGVGSVTLAVRLYLGMQRIRNLQEEAETIVKKRTSPRKTSRKTQSQPTPVSNAPLSASTVMKSKSESAPSPAPTPVSDTRPSQPIPGSTVQRSGKVAPSSEKPSSQSSDN